MTQLEINSQSTHFQLPNQLQINSKSTHAEVRSSQSQKEWQSFHTEALRGVRQGRLQQRQMSGTQLQQSPAMAGALCCGFGSPQFQQSPATAGATLRLRFFIATSAGKEVQSNKTFGNIWDIWFFVRRGYATYISTLLIQFVPDERQFFVRRGYATYACPWVDKARRLSKPIPPHPIPSRHHLFGDVQAASPLALNPAPLPAPFRPDASAPSPKPR